MHPKRIGEFDSWRGVLVLWVIFGHISLVSGIKIPLLNAPGYAVDLFMVISGYFIQDNLMTFRLNGGGFLQTIKNFYVKRIKRIYPHYLVSLTIFYLITYLVSVFDLLPFIYYSFLNIENLFINATLLNGLIPKYSNSMPIPSWSLSLEIQFYLIAPLIFYYRLYINRFFIIICGILCIIFSLYFGPLSAHVDYSLPSIIPLRLMVFMAGMAWRASKEEGQFSNFYLILIMIGIGNLNISIFILFLLFSIKLKDHFPLKPILENFNLQKIGLISYELYLVHAPIILFYIIFSDHILPNLSSEKYLNLLVLTFFTLVTSFISAKFLSRVRF